MAEFQFIGGFNMTEEGSRIYGITKYIPLRAANILAALKEMERIIRKKANLLIKADLITKANAWTESGEPFYKRQMRTLVNIRNGQFQPSNWHFIDEWHNESSYEEELLLWSADSQTCITCIACK